MAISSAKFEHFLDACFESLLDDQPILANISGLPSGEGKLGQVDPSFQSKQEQRRQKTLAALDAISPTDLSPDQHLDRLALRARLLREINDYSRNRHALEPAAVEQVLNLLLHELIRGDDEPARAARNLRAILRQIPSYLSDAAWLIDQPDPTWLKIMEQCASGAPALLQAISTFLTLHAPAQSDHDRIQSAQHAFERYRDIVLDRPHAPEGSFAIGPVELHRRIRDELGLDYSLGQIESLALSEISRVNSLLQSACRPFGKNKTPDAIIASARDQWDPGPDLLHLYRQETARVAHGFKKASAVSFPSSDSLEVKPVPDFMRSLLPTAAYTSPGAFEKRQRGIFWVNDLSLTKHTDSEKNAERAQHFGLPLTCAHEAYPGHHLQFVIANQHSRKWRRLFAHAIFYEGWTLWCEQMMVDLRIDHSPWLKVQQLHDALWRCHRILVDLRLQSGRYSYAQAVRHLQKNLGFTRARAEADVNWYTGQPAVPMSYWLGRLENQRLFQRLVQGRKWPLKKFNDWLLGFGTLPQSWIEKYALD